RRGTSSEGATSTLQRVAQALAAGSFLFVNALDNSTARVNYRQMLRFSLLVSFSLAFINLLLNSI
ncbi:MAG TPA: hypothetical protein PKE63_11115, partial [Lacibacter sp.]|nr:hypothetical protein [Lacibacter sp.]